MEGKVVLSKKFADIDVFDLGIDRDGEARREHKPAGSGRLKKILGGGNEQA